MKSFRMRAYCDSRGAASTLCVVVCAAALVAAPASAKEPIFVSPEQSRLSEFLPAPPADGSPAQRAELAELHAIAAARNDAQIAHARFDAENENIRAFVDILGPKIDLAALPLTSALAQHVVNDASVNVKPVKTYFHRIHPYTFDPTLPTVCKSQGAAESYPSGHAAVGYLLALSLSEMLPEKRDALLARADDFAHSRLICGVHYPSDLAASRSLAYAVHALMTANPQYRAEIAAAKVELRAASTAP